MLPDYHLHTPLCRHASGTPIEFARAAVNLGMTEIGFADHNPMPEHFDDWRMEREDFPRYLQMIEEAQRAFPQLTIRLGLECDFIAGHESWIEQLAGMAPWDFLIGSVHYIAPGWAVDNPKWIGRFRERPVEEIWEMYWRAYEQCIRSGLFDFVAHPDLVKKFGFRPDGDLRRYYEGSIAAAADKGTAIEINTAGLRKDVRELYPARDFLEMAFAANVPIVINSDAHAPDEVGADFSAAVALAREVGYRGTLRFAGRKSHLEPIPAC
jgi:histidinol-phosphatase (PHP family)